MELVDAMERETGQGRSAVDQHSRRALKSLDLFSLAATPRNYTVWYAYHAGEEPELGRTIDVLMSNGQRITNEICAELHARHFTSEDQSQAILGVSGRIEKAVEQIMAAVGEAGDSAAQFGARLQSFTGKLAGESAVADLRDAARAILEETHAVQARNKRLEDQLKSSSREVADLRQHLEDTRREAITDSLTGLFNRKHFDVSLRDAAGQCMEKAMQLSVLMVDIDHFKQFNDMYGHQIGDHVLRLVAANMKSNLKGKDVAARYGGEEFAAILPDTDLPGAEAIGEQLRNAVATRKLVRKNSGESLGKVTMSVGIAAYRPGEPLDELVERADQALYMAKRTGRNRVLTERALAEPVAVNQ
jgi:diguanylate cyclase